MPNWCDCELEIDGAPELKERILNEIRGDCAGKESLFDFNKVVPMPKELDIESGNIGENALEAWYGDCDSQLRLHGLKSREELQARLLSAHPNSKELADAYKTNLEKYGFETWYGWCPAHWGTKWNAHETRMTDDGNIRFETAWEPPIPVIETLAEKYPKATFTLHYRNEGEDTDVTVTFDQPTTSSE